MVYFLLNNLLVLAVTFLNIGYALIILSLLCFNANMQACETTGSQANTTVQVNSYINSSSSASFEVRDIVVDGSDNRYIFYVPANVLGTQTIYGTKIATDDSYVWSLQYTNMNSKENIKSVLLSNDETKIRVLGQQFGNPQVSEIATSNHILNF